MSWARTADAREADLRMDTQDGTRADLGGYAAIVPGDLANSEAWQRIIHEDPDELMPPADSNRALSKKAQRTPEALDSGRGGI